MTAISPIKLPTLAFVVNPEGHAGIVYDSPTGKRTVIARGTLGPFAWYGTEPVMRVARFWREPVDESHRFAREAKAGRAQIVEREFRELAKVEGWSVLVDARGIAKVLERGELTEPSGKPRRGEV